MHLIKFLQSGEHLFALWQQRQVANEHVLSDTTVERGQYTTRSDGLQNCSDDAAGDVLAHRIAAGFAKERGDRKSTRLNSSH